MENEKVDGEINVIVKGEKKLRLVLPDNCDPILEIFETDPDEGKLKFSLYDRSALKKFRKQVIDLIDTAISEAPKVSNKTNVVHV